MSALKNELGDFRQNSHEFFGEQRKVSGIAYLPLTFRLPSAYLPLTIPLTLPLTLPLQEALQAALFCVDDTKFVFKKSSVLGFPPGFYHFVHRNYFRSF